MIFCLILYLDVLLWTSKIWYCVLSYVWLYCVEPVKYDILIDPMSGCIALNMWNMRYSGWSYIMVYCFEQLQCITLFDPMSGSITLDKYNMILWVILWVGALLWTSKLWYCVWSYDWLYCFEHVKYDTLVDPIFGCIALNKYNVMPVLCWNLWVAACFEHVKYDTVSDPMSGCIALNK